MSLEPGKVFSARQTLGKIYMGSSPEMRHLWQAEFFFQKKLQNNFFSIDCLNYTVPQKMSCARNETHHSSRF